MKNIIISFFLLLTIFSCRTAKPVVTEKSVEKSNSEKKSIQKDSVFIKKETKITPASSNKISLPCNSDLKQTAIFGDTKVTVAVKDGIINITAETKETRQESIEKKESKSIDKSSFKSDLKDNQKIIKQPVVKPTVKEKSFFQKIKDKIWQILFWVIFTLWIFGVTPFKIIKTMIFFVKTIFKIIIKFVKPV